MDDDPSAVADTRCISSQAGGRPIGCAPRWRVGPVFPEEKRASATSKGVIDGAAIDAGVPLSAGSLGPTLWKV